METEIPKKSRKKKSTTQYVCTQCGSSTPKWTGRCGDCGSWNSFEEIRTDVSDQSVSGVDFVVTDLSSITFSEKDRISTGFQELDRALGGGVVPGSTVLIGGEPGIGKSTLMLQVLSNIAEQNRRTLYVSGEESLQQVKMRAARCGVQNDALLISNATTLGFVLSAIEKHKPQVVVCDSVQAMTSETAPGIAGSVQQIREVSGRLIEFTKSRGISLFLIGHVTKEGQIAGPKLLEHAVDCVAYFEQSDGDQVRILRTHKNRFGPTFEVGIFEMHAAGIKEIHDASSLFVHHYAGRRVGSVFYPSLQGSRPLMLEVQALTSPCQFGAPRRQGTGVDNTRIALLAAILEKNVGLKFSSQDIFVNIVGGVSEKDPALDLAISLCLISSFKNRPVPTKIMACGECGLSGEVRQVSYLGRRVKEALGLKMEPLLVPKSQAKDLKDFKGQKDVHLISGVAQLMEYA
jgi:DNA repair protein RadA/Sms